jgi:hypothetical protein
MPLRRAALLPFLVAGSALAAEPAPAPNNPLDPDPGRHPQEVCVLYDARVVHGFNLSRARAASLGRLLAGGGVPASVFPAPEIATALSPPCRVAHLVRFDEAALPPGAEARLRAFVAGGGRIVAWGCSGPSLEKLFGVEAGAYTPAGGGRTWTHFEPVEGALPFAPERVENEAAGVVAFAPASKDAEPVAFWRATGREEPGPPAALRAPAGFWIARLLYDDGSGADRARFAASLCCALHPPLLPGVAERIRANLYAPFGATDANAAEASCLDPAAPRDRDRAVRDAFRKHRRRMEAARRAAAGAAGTAAADLVGALWRETTELGTIYATAHPLGADRAGRRLCVWEKTGYGPFDGDWDRAAAALAEAGVSDAMVFAGSLAGAVAAVPGVPPTPERARRGGRDPFPDAVRACHERGIRVHAWFPALQFDRAPADRSAAFDAAGRLLHREDGKRADWLDPRNEENLADLSAALAWIAANEGVDGLCLDYVRYPDFPTREAPRAPEALAELLRRVRADVRAASPDCEFSAAVFGSAVNGGGEIVQNWGAWLDAGLIDRAVPMNYVPDREALGRLLSAQRARLGRAICGIGATSHAALLSGPELLEQLRAAYRAGCAGAAIYPFDRRFADELLPVLRAAK